jgi:hypothetical protein
MFCTEHLNKIQNVQNVFIAYIDFFMDVIM